MLVSVSSSGIQGGDLWRWHHWLSHCILPCHEGCGSYCGGKSLCSMCFLRYHYHLEFTDVLLSHSSRPTAGFVILAGIRYLWILKTLCTSFSLHQQKGVLASHSATSMTGTQCGIFAIPTRPRPRSCQEGYTLETSESINIRHRVHCLYR